MLSLREKSVEQLVGGTVSRVRVIKNISRQKRQQNPISTFASGAVIIAVICLIIVIVGRSKDQKREQTLVESTPSRIWKLPPPPRELGPANFPGTPPLREVLKSQKADAVVGYDPESLSLRLKLLIENHPLTIINRELRRRMDSGEIFRNWEPASGLYAQFQIVTSGDVRMPTISINPQWLAEVKTAEQVYVVYLVLLHEYAHFVQYERGDETTKRFFASHRLTEFQLQITKEQLCEFMWSTELDAYTQECRVANKWGYDHMYTFCLYVDSPAWRQANFKRLYKSAEPQEKQTCGSIFAQQAGHPHPELF